jgi:hypothetical protein
MCSLLYGGTGRLVDWSYRKKPLLPLPRKDVLTMNDREIHVSQMAVRLKDFEEARAGAFAAESRGGQKFAAVSALVVEIERLGAEQAATAGAAQGSTTAKREARENIRRQMKAMRDTSVALEGEQPGISRNFRMPPTNGDQALINSARAFIEAATPLKTLFISNELPATFLEDLATAVASFERSVSLYNQRRAENASATAALKNALSGVIKLKAELDPIVRNKFRNDPATLAAWNTASRLKRVPQRRQPTATESPAEP